MFLRKVLAIAILVSVGCLWSGNAANAQEMPTPDQLKTTAGSGGADMCGFRRIVGRRGTFYQNDLGDGTSGAVKGMVYDPDSSWKAVR